MTGKIKWRLLASYVAIIFAAMTILGLLLSYSIERHFVLEIKGTLRAHALLLRDLVESKYASSKGLTGLDEDCRRLASQTHARITIYDSRGKVIARGDSYSASVDPFIPQPSRVNTRGFGCRLCHNESASKSEVNVRVPFKHDGRTAGTIELSSPLYEVRHIAGKIRRIVFAIVLGTTIIAVLIARRLAAGIGGPITHMNEMALRMAGGDLRQRVAVRSRDEIGQLASSLNVMADRLHDNLNQLAQEKSKLEMILTTMADPIIVIGQDRRVALFNPASERMFGVMGDQIVGRRLDEFRNLRDVDLIARQALDSAGTIRTEIEIRTPVRLEINAYASPINDQDGNITGVLVVLRDVTEYRRLAEMRKDFVANVSHELRTPVASLRAVVGALQSGAIDDPEAAERFLGSLDSEVERLSRLLEDLLNLSELESGKTVLRRTLVCLRELAEEAVRDLQSIADSNGLTVSVGIPKELSVQVDRAQIKQVMTNLLDNAIKYTPEGGSIEVYGRDANNFVTVSVRDTGVGIPLEDLDRIFERFYRVDKARSRKMGGTGLGLAIVQDIVEAHGGRVMVDSEAGQGSTFTIVLPKRAPDSDPEVRPLW